MISVRQIPDSNMIEMHISGAVTAEQFEKVIDQIEAAIKTHGKLRVMKHIEKLALPPIPFSKFWDDIRFAMKHFGDFTHAAIVTDIDWVRAWAKAWSPLLKMKVKTFTPDETNKAWHWLREEP